MATIVVLIGVTGDDVFARHAGMTVAAPAVTPDTPRSAEHTFLAPAIPQDAGQAVTTHSGQGPPGDAAAHLLHQLGACLSVLALSVLLLRPGGGWRVSTRAHRAPTSKRLLASHWLASARGSPPTLAPPRASPVIRT